ncbi:MAG: YIP1 family protein [Candidatus Krumholzibacteria bacterium]|nr:YIP1 family protein [Candidatus Krumholzibacteria bacterium]
MLNLIWDKVVGLLTRPEVRVRHVEAHWNPVLGVVCGLVGTLAFPLSSLLARTTAEELRPHEMQTLLRETLPVSVAYFVLANLVVFLTARLFGGRGNLLRYLSATGWAGLFAILWSLLLLPILFVGPTWKPKTARSGYHW